MQLDLLDERGEKSPPALFYTTRGHVFTRLVDTLASWDAGSRPHKLTFPRAWAPNWTEQRTFLQRCALACLSFYPRKREHPALRRALTVPNADQDTMKRGYHVLRGLVRHSPDSRQMEARLLLIHCLKCKERGEGSAIRLGSVAERASRLLGEDVAEVIAIQTFAASICGGVPESLRARMERVRQLSHTSVADDPSSGVLLWLYLLAWRRSGLPHFELVDLGAIRWESFAVERCHRCSGFTLDILQSQEGECVVSCRACRGLGVVAVGHQCPATVHRVQRLLWPVRRSEGAGCEAGDGDVDRDQCASLREPGYLARVLIGPCDGGQYIEQCGGSKDEPCC